MSDICDVRVLGGLPLIAHYTSHPAEPDCGYFSRYCELDHLTDQRGRPVPWAEKRMTRRDYESVTDQIEREAG